MSTITTQDDLFASLGIAAPQSANTPTNDPTDLGLTTFLKLMVTQLNNQDPFKPMENGDFLGQIAQFGSVTGLEKLNQNFESLAASITSGQALQAGGLVGREVLVPVEAGYLVPGQPIRGRVEIDQNSPQVKARITDIAGQLVRELPLGPATPGSLDFSWDGLDEVGGYAPPGIYNVNIEAVYGDETVDMQTQLFSRVESVNLSDRNGLTLNLQGLGPVAFNNVKQVF
jgi:flagellar basal-body rod modification protein FlgD